MNFFPSLTNSEYIDFKLNSKKYKIQDDFNIVNVVINEKLINNKEIDNQLQNDIFFSDFIMNDIKKILIKIQLEINIFVLDNKLNVIENCKINKEIDNNKISDNDFLESDNLEKIISKYNESIFISKSKKFLLPFSSKNNQQYFHIINNFAYSKNNIDALMKLKNNIKNAVKEFSDYY